MIKLIKLLNGQDLVAEIVSDGYPQDLKIKNPVAIVVIPSKMDSKTPSVGFAPWAEFSDDKTFRLNYSHILTIMEPIKEFVTQYKATFSGIVMPQNQILRPGL
jgi:hypothetical protein